MRIFRFSALRKELLNEISVMGELLFEGFDVGGES